MIVVLLVFAVLVAVTVLAAEAQAIRSRRRLADAGCSRLPAPMQRVRLRR